MHVPLDLARTLAAVVDERTLDAAARRLHLTPSAVSQRIRALEERLGRIVLVRTKPARATEAGEVVVRFARQVELLERDALTSLGADDDAAAVVPLAVNADSLATWFLAPLARLSVRRDVVFELHRDDQDFTTSLLESGTVLAAVTSRADPVAGCRVQPLGALRYLAVASPGFAARWFATGVEPGALSRAPVVDFDRRDDLQTRWLRSNGADPGSPPRHLVPASSDFATAVRLGLGWSLLPLPQAADDLAAGALVALGGEPVDVPLYWQQWNLTSPLLDDIADEVVEAGTQALFA